MSEDNALYSELDRLTTRCAQLECELATALKKRGSVKYEGELTICPTGRGIVLHDWPGGATSLENILGYAPGDKNVIAMGWTGRVKLEIELLE